MSEVGHTRFTSFQFIENMNNIQYGLKALQTSEKQKNPIDKVMTYGVGVLSSSTEYSDRSAVYGVKINVHYDDEVDYGVSVEMDSPIYAHPPETMLISSRSTHYEAIESSTVVSTRRKSIYGTMDELSRFYRMSIDGIISSLGDMTRYGCSQAEVISFEDTRKLSNLRTDIVDLTKSTRMNDYISDLVTSSDFVRGGIIDTSYEDIHEANLFSDTFNIEVDTFYELSRSIMEHVVDNEYTMKGVLESTYEYASIDVLADSNRINSTLESLVDIIADYELSRDPIESVIDVLFDTNREMTFESMMDLEVRSRLSAVNTQIEELQTALRIALLDTELGQYEELKKYTDIDTYLSGMDLGTRDVLLLANVVEEELSKRDLTVTSIGSDFDYGVRDYTFEGTIGIIESAKRDVLLGTEVYDYDKLIRDYTVDTEVSLPGYMSKVSNLITMYDELDEGTRNVSVDTDFDNMRDSKKYTDILTSVEEPEISSRVYLEELLMQDIEGASRRMSHNTILDAIEDYTRDITSETVQQEFESLERAMTSLTVIGSLELGLRDYTFEAQLEDQTIFEVWGIITLIEELEMFSRDIIYDSEIDGGSGEFIRTSKYAIIETVDEGVRDLRLDAYIDLSTIAKRDMNILTVLDSTEVFERNVVFITDMELIESAERDHRKKGKVVKKNGAKLNRKLTANVVKIEQSSRDVRLVAHVEKSSGGIRMNDKSAIKLLSESSVRNVLNSAEVLKTAIGERDNSLRGEIIDNGGNGSLLDEKKLIWLIMGKQQPWSPWNWKKTR